MLSILGSEQILFLANIVDRVSYYRNFRYIPVMCAATMAGAKYFRDLFGDMRRFSFSHVTPGSTQALSTYMSNR